MAADPAAIAHICVTTNTAAAAASLSALITAAVLLGKPDLSMILNGCLAGLVAITAPCAFVSVPSSLIIGLVAGFLVVVGVLFFDKIKIDDPVGALSVHLLNGIFGTLAIGLFADSSVAPVTGPPDGLFVGGGFGPFFIQLIGVLAAGAYTLGISLVAFGIIKAVMGLRVEPEEEMEGLDVGEHGMTAYPDFVIASEAMGQGSISGTPSGGARAASYATHPARA
jgi:Amt family ammonium transporter